MPTPDPQPQPDRALAAVVTAFGPRLAVAALLAALVVSALAARAVSPDAFLELDPHPDTVEYVLQAKSLMETGTTSLRINGEQVPSRYSWGFPLLIAPIFALAGADYGLAIFAVLASSALCVLFAFAAARQVFGAWAGLVAAACVATSGLDRFLSGFILSEVPSAMAMAATLAATLVAVGRLSGPRPDVRAGLLLCAAAGTVFGFACWIRVANVLHILPLALLIGLPTWRRTGPLGLREVVSALACFGLAWAAMMAPVLVYNVAEFGSPLRTGYNFWLDAPNGTPVRMFGLDWLNVPAGKWRMYLQALVGVPIPVFDGKPQALAEAPFIVLAGACIVLAPAGLLAARRRARDGSGACSLPMRHRGIAAGFVLAALVALGLTYASAAAFRWGPDARLLHGSLAWLAVLAAGGFKLIADGLAALARRVRGETGDASPSAAAAAAVAALIVVANVWALSDARANRPVVAPVRRAWATTFAERAEPDAVLVSDELEPVFFAAFQPRTSSQTLVFLRRPLVHTTAGTLVPSVAQDAALLSALMGQGRPMYFIGAWNGTLERFRAYTEFRPFQLAPAFDVPVSPYVTARIYRVQVRAGE